MQNKIKTFEDCEFSIRPRRLIFFAQSVENPVTAESADSNSLKVKNFPQLLRELEKRGKTFEDIQKIISATGDNRTGKVQKLEDIWAGDTLTFKSPERKQVAEKTKAEADLLKKSVEVQKKLKGVSRKCENAKTETVAVIVDVLAGADSKFVTAVSIKKKNGKMVKLERKGDDFVEVDKNKHFPIYRGDTVVIGHEIFSADQKLNDSTKLKIESRQKKEDVVAALREPEKAPAPKIKIPEIQLGVERANASETVQKILARGIRQVSENFFVGEHGALAGLALEEKQKVLSLFEQNGKIKDSPLAVLTQLVVAAAGKVETPDQAKMKSELLSDAARFGGEIATLVAIPSILATLTTGGLTLAGYFPLAYIDIGRGIRQGKLEIFDKGDIKLLEDISALDGEIVALENKITRLGANYEATSKISTELEQLRKQKSKLGQIAVLRKMKKVRTLLENKNLDPATRQKLERDDKILTAEAVKGLDTLKPEEFKEYSKKYSSEIIAKKQDAEFVALQKLVEELQAGGILTKKIENPKAVQKNLKTNLEALKRSLDQRQNETEQLRMWFFRWFGSNIETPQQAMDELDEMIHSEVYGINEMDDRLRYRANLWDDTDFVLKNLFGIEKGKKPTFKNYSKAGKNEYSLIDLAELAKNPVGAKISKEKLTELKKLEEDPKKQKQFELILSRFEKYFTPAESVSSDDHERDPERIKLAREILENKNMSLAEKVYRLSVLTSSENIFALEKKLVLRTNIENDKKVRDVLTNLSELLEVHSFIENFAKMNPVAAKKLNQVVTTARWIKQKLDLKNLDQNASLHAKINDTLSAPLEEIQKYSAEIVKMAHDGISLGEANAIAAKVDELESSLTDAKRTTEALLKFDESGARESHDREAVENIRDPELKKLNEKFTIAPITERALPDGELPIFKKFAKELVGDGAILQNKEAFRAKMLDGFQFKGLTIKLKNYEFYKNSKGTEASNLPMVAPENIDGVDDPATREQIARQLNLLILNVEQSGKNIADTFFGNTKERAGMHLRNAELAEAVGHGKWLSQKELLEKYSGYISNTGQKNVEDLNHFVAGKHPGGKFGGAFELDFTRRVSAEINGQMHEFEINYTMLSREACFNAVFVNNSKFKEITQLPPDKIQHLTYAEAIAGVQRQLFLLGIPLYYEFEPKKCCNCGNSVNNDFIDDSPTVPNDGITLNSFGNSGMN